MTDPTPTPVAAEEALRTAFETLTQWLNHNQHCPARLTGTDCICGLAKRLADFRAALTEEGPEPRREAHELSDYQRGYVDGFDAPVNLAARSAAPTPEAAGLREALDAAIEGLLGTPRPTLDAGPAGIKEWELAFYRLLTAYRASKGEIEMCPVRSSVTDQSCLLPVGHPQDSADRFHRYAAPSQPARADLDAAVRTVLRLHIKGSGVDRCERCEAPWPCAEAKVAARLTENDR